MILKKYKYRIGAILTSVLLLVSCTNGGQKPATSGATSNPAQGSPVVTQSSAPASTQVKVEPKVMTPAEIQAVKPNESGQIMVVMFHNFVETYTPTKDDNGEYTTTFAAFEKLLDTLYQANYRLISMDDFINNNISVPAGKIPIIFTFDDGTAGQFNLVEESGKLVTNTKSAVGIMEAFSKKNPDFGLKGMFYLNLGNDATFNGKGTLSQRLQYLIDKGFELGNHTVSHVNLKGIKDKAKILEEIGGNQKRMDNLVKGYKLKTFSLPLGILPQQDLQTYTESGEYEGVKYENSAIMLVGANPTLAPGSKNLKLNRVARVRASGIKPVDCDLEWWIKQLSKGGQYISDGNPDTVTLPKSKEGNMDPNKLKGKKLVTY